eukprot:g4786.t1
MKKTTKPQPFRLDDFTLEKAVHNGAFGTVYKAIHKTTGIVYAMKQVSLKGMKRIDREEAIDEARVLSTLHHPHIIKHHGKDEKLCIVMDYAEGGSLYRRIRESKDGCLMADETWRMFLQCLLALDYTLQKRIIHRDIKSLNILLLKTHGGDFVLSDFGIARALATDSDFARTLLGTPFYLSPELCDDAPYNEKSDIWALGVVLYECITGELPFFARNEGALIRKILKGDYKPPRNCPEDLKEIISKCLIYDHCKRPNASELLKLSCVKKRAKQLQINLDLNNELKNKRKDEPNMMVEGVAKMQLNPKVQELSHEDKSTPKIENETEQVLMEEIVAESAKPAPVVLIENHGQQTDKNISLANKQDTSVNHNHSKTQQLKDFGVPKKRPEKDQFQLYQASRLEDEDLVWNAVYSAPTFARKRCPDLMTTYPASVSRSMSSSTSSTAHITTKQAVSTSYEQSVISTCYKS